jgi:hypothetical protein
MNLTGIGGQTMKFATAQSDYENLIKPDLSRYGGKSIRRRSANVTDSI